MAWWIGVLFAIGSVLFLVPALASLGSSADWIGVTFFVGSIFFTTASLLQLLAALNVPHRLRGRPRASWRRPRAWIPARVDVLSALVQFPGTILFNVNTWNAMKTGLDTRQSNVKVWAPDFVGSACFLVASLLAFANVEHSWLSWRPRDPDWQIAALNLAGSLAFGAAAIASFYRPATGDAVSDQIANGGTALGAICFLVGALMLLPQAERQASRAQ